MDAVTIDCVERYRPGSLPRAAAAVLLIEVDGEAGSVEGQMTRAISACEDSGGRMIRLAANADESEDLWEARRSISAALGRLAPSKVGEDISVPRTRVPEMLEQIQAIAARYGMTIAVFGHAADGNLHPNILTDRNDPAKMKQTESAIADIFAAALDLGGTLSGEHGIGTAKAPYMRAAVPGETIEMMRKIKQALDPKGILNPGKMFPPPSSA
jgi:glycolate oxidase